MGLLENDLSKNITKEKIIIIMLRLKMKIDWDNGTLGFPSTHKRPQIKSLKCCYLLSHDAFLCHFQACTFCPPTPTFIKYFYFLFSFNHHIIILYILLLFFIFISPAQLILLSNQFNEYVHIERNKIGFYCS